MKKFIKFLLLPFLAITLMFGLNSCNKGDNREELKLSLTDASFTYDGNEHSLQVTGEIPSDITLEYTGNNKTDAGTYTVTCKVIDEQNKYKPVEDMSATMTINKANYDLSEITFSDKVFKHDGEAHSLKIEGTLPSTLSVSYENNNKTEVGNYEVIANFTNTSPNYNDPLPLKANMQIVDYVFDENDIVIDNLEFTYDGTEHKVNVTAPENFDLTVSNNVHTDAGTYDVLIKIKDKTYPDFTINDIVKQMVIKKADYDMSGISFNNKTVTYNKNKHPLAIEGVLPSSDLSVVYENNDNINAGTYKVKATFIHNNKNYNDIDPLEATLTINKATYDMSKISLSDKTVTYDTNKHILAIEGTLPSEDITVSYENNDNKNAGVYKVKANFVSSDSNYNVIPSLEATLTINKATIDTSDLSMNNKTVTYDGYAHEILVEQTTPNPLISIKYANNSKSEAGVYTVTGIISPKDPANYNEIEDLTATLTIEKAVYDMSGISFNDKTVTYDGKLHQIQLTGKWGVELKVSYENYELTNAGSILATAKFNTSNNYLPIEDMHATLTILKADLDSSKFEYYFKEATYSGYNYKLTIKDLPSNFNVTYENNAHVDAGEYQVTYKVVDTNGNYNDCEGSVTQVILPKEFDASKYTFTSSTFYYNNQPKYIYVNATALPEGISISYENNGQTSVGNYTVTATFTSTNPNYKIVVPTITAELTINKGTWNKDIYTVIDNEFVYDGLPHEVIFEVSDPTITYVVQSTKNTDAGTYETKVEFSSPNYNGNAIYRENYEILKADIDLSVFSMENKTVTYDGKPHKIELTCSDKDIAKLVHITYSPKEQVNAGKYTFVATLTSLNANYNSPRGGIAAELIINKAPIDYGTPNVIDPIREFDTWYKTFYLENVKEGVHVRYSNNSQLNAGKYTMLCDFYIDNNYEEVKDVPFEFEIKPQPISSDNIRFNDSKFSYDGTPKSIEAVSSYDFVKITYENNSQTEPGTYTVKAFFESDKNHIVTPTSKEAQLTIINEGNIYYVTIIEDEKVIVKKYFEGTLYDHKHSLPLKPGYKIEQSGIPNTITQDEYPIYRYVPNQYLLYITDDYGNGFKKNRNLKFYANEEIDLFNFYVPENYIITECKTSQGDIVTSIPQFATESVSITRKLKAQNYTIEYFVNNELVETNTVGANSAYTVKSINGITNWNNFTTQYAENAVIDSVTKNLILYDDATTFKYPDYEFNINQYRQEATINKCPFDTAKVIIPKYVYYGEGDNAILCTVNKIKGYGTNIENKIVTEIVLPDSIVEIGDNAFNYLVALNKINLPNSVEKIGYESFNNCTALDNVVLPKNLYEIGNYAFMNCKSLSKIIIPDNVTKIPVKAFYGCINLSYLDLNSVEGVFMAAFENCNNLTEIVMSNNLIQFESEAFAYVPYFEDFVLPKSAKVLGYNVFNNCPNLKSITIQTRLYYIDQIMDNDNPIDIKFDISYEEASMISVMEEHPFGTNPTFYFLQPDGTYKKLTELKIGVGDMFMNHIFNDSKDITSIVIEDGVETIHKRTFKYLKSVTSITIPESVKYIEDNAFEYMDGLTSVTLPKNVISLGKGAFYNARNVKAVYLNDNLETLEAQSLFFIGNDNYYIFTGNAKLTNVASNAFNYNKVHFVVKDVNKLDLSIVPNYGSVHIYSETAPTFDTNTIHNPIYVLNTDYTYGPDGLPVLNS